MRKSISFLIILFILSYTNQIVFGQTTSWGDELNLLRQVNLLPVYRSNSVVEQISSYDRTGGNDDGFSGKYSYIRVENNKLVLADLQGPGVINRIWTATPTEDTVSFYFDGESTPRLKIKFSELFAGSIFPFMSPVSGNAIGGHYSYVPIHYKESCKILFHGSKIEFIQIQYRNLPDTSIESYNNSFSAEDRNIMLNVRGVWANVFPSVSNFTNANSSNIQTHTEQFILNPGDEKIFFDTDIPGRIVGFEIDGGNGFEGQYKDVILSARWDNEDIESIYSPLADFFGYAYGKGSMRSILIGRYANNNYCYIPMPYDNNATLKLSYKIRKMPVQQPIPITVKVFYNNISRVVAQEGKFYAVWRREINPPIGRYYDFLKVDGKGHYIGTMHIAQGLRPGVTLFFEGDDVTYVDGKMTIHGTGSEDYYNGGWYNIAGRWDRAHSLGIHGSLDYNTALYRTGGYRFFLSDKMSFEKNIRHSMEHGPEGNEFPVDYTSVAYFYNSSPLTERMEPTEHLREVYIPQEPFLRPNTKEFDINMRPQHGDILVVDIDNDNDLDLIIGGEQRSEPFAYQGGTFTNDGKGNFTRIPNNITPAYMATMDAGDIDGDGDIDIIFNGGTNVGAVWSKGIALNDGFGNFTLAPTSQYPIPPSRSVSSFFGDFNNDGLLDYCHSGNSADSYMALYFQQTDGSFLADRDSFNKYKFSDILAKPVDYNNDGYVDIFVMAWLDEAVDGLLRGRFTGIFENNGTGNFTLISQPQIRMKSYGSADWADMDGNGWLDFIMHGEGTGSFDPNDWKYTIYRNEDGIFSEAFIYERTRQFSVGGAAVLQDIDNDGDPDVLFGGWSDRLIPSPRQKTFVYMNNDKNNKLEYEDLNENYFLSNQYLPGMSEQDFEIADLDGDFRPDFIYSGFAENYHDNPYNPNRVISGWSPSPDDQGLYMFPFVKLSAPQNLNATIFNDGINNKVILSWEEPLNNSGRKSTTYNLYLQDKNSGKWLYNPMAVIGGENDGWRKINRLGNVFLNKRIELVLPDGEYEWSVQAIDAARFGGNFAPIENLQIITGLKDFENFSPYISVRNNQVFIKLSSGNLNQIKIYNLLGQKIIDKQFTISFQETLPDGIYIIEIGNSKNRHKSKIIVN